MTASIPNSQIEPSDSCAAPDVLNKADLAVEFEKNRGQLRRMVSLRLSPCLATRIDASDILQDAFIRANADFDQYRSKGDMSLSCWFRIQTRFAVGDCHRRHLHTQKRDARQEEIVFGSMSTPALDQLAESVTSASSVFAKEELGQQVRHAIERMADLDREILILRHLEDVSIVDAAAELDISVETAKKRHLRAIKRLREMCQPLVDPVDKLN